MPRIDVDIAQVAELLAGGSERVLEGITRSFNLSGQRARNEILRRMREEFKTKSGALESTIGWQVDDGPSGPELRIGTLVAASKGNPLAYAWQREKGGPIQGHPWLAWPIVSADTERAGIVTEAGIGGVRARDVKEDPEAFGFSSTFVLGSIIFGVVPGASSSIAGGVTKGVRRKTGGIGPGKWSIVPLFYLKHEVTQEGSNIIFGTVEEMLPEIAASARRWASRALSNKGLPSA